VPNVMTLIAARGAFIVWARFREFPDPRSMARRAVGQREDVVWSPLSGIAAGSFFPALD
jgi:hypothetical protein